MTATAAHFAALRLLRHAESRGVPADAVAQRLGTDAGTLARPGRLPLARLSRTWAWLRTELDDAAIGARAAQAWALDDLGLLGFCLSAAPTVGDALDFAVERIGMVTDPGAWRVVAAQGSLRLSWARDLPPVAGVEISDEVMVASFVRCYRELAGTAPLHVDLVRPPPRSRSEHEALLRCGVRFRCEENAIVIDRADLDRALPGARPALWSYLCALAEEEVRGLGSGAAADRVARFVAARLREHGRRPDILEAAHNLAMSERTLRRRLREEGTSFRRISTDVSLQHAAARLESSAESFTQIALEAGFAGATSFGRAWRRRRGEAPSSTRRRLHA